MRSQAEKPIAGKALGSPASPTVAELAAEPFVVRNAETVFSFNADGTGSREQTLTIAIQSEAALHAFGVISTPFAGSSERVQFRYARVRHPDGTVVQTPPETALEQPDPVTREAPLYSDLKQMQLPVRNLHLGDTLEWQVHVDRFKAEAPHDFWGRDSFLKGAVVLSESVVLHVPLDGKVTVWTNPRAKVVPTSSADRTQRTYQWKTAALQLTAGTQAADAARAKAKVVLTAEEQLDATQGALPDLAWTSFASWEAVGAWYRGLEAGRTEATPALTAKVNELTAGKATLEEKVRAVYGYVSGQVHYIGVDLGVGRYQPHPADEVLENQFGDCKDKHTLLAAMLSVLGLHPEAVLIGSSIRFNDEVPAPDNFNHLITRVQVGAETVWLDSTLEVAPYRMLFGALRDKQALVVPDAGSPLIARTPSDPPFPTFEKMVAIGTLDKDGVSESHFTMTQRGDEELLLRMVQRQITPAQYDQVVQQLVANLGFGGTVSHAQFLHAEDTTMPLAVEWDYHREQAGNDWQNLRTLPQLMMVLLPSVDEKQPPIQNVSLLGARSVTSTSELRLPAGWSAELPDPIHAKSEFGTYDLTFRYEKGILYADRHWTLLKKEVPQADWKHYKSWLDAAAITTEPYVQLRRTSAAAAETSPATQATPKVTADPESVHLMAEALDAIQHNRLDEGAAFLDKAKAIDAKQQNLWAYFGMIAFRRGDHNAAIRDYTKEIDAYPESVWLYQPLSQQQYMTGDHGGAIATLRRYVTQSPNNAAAAAALISMLSKEGKVPEAAAEADAALGRLPASAATNSVFELEAGNALLRGGETKQGVEELRALLKDTTDRGLLNSAAYALADADQDLPLAEATERDVLARQEEESATWSLKDSVAELRSKSSLITASWDTTGWILYREGKLAEAEPYIEARWQSHTTALIGQHLGDVQLSRKHKEAALHSFRLALAAVPDHDAMGVRIALTSPEAIDLKLRIGQLNSGDAEPDVSAERAELQAMHTIPLPRALGHDGSVEYKLLFSTQGVKEVAPVDAEKFLAGGADLLRTIKLPKELIPPGSHAFLMRVGTLNCHSGKCEFVLLP